VDKARSREAGGSGLGLAIVRTTVLEYGGKIDAEHRAEAVCALLSPSLSTCRRAGIRARTAVFNPIIDPLAGEEEKNENHLLTTGG
jgi:signal transduction histidine kinase